MENCFTMLCWFLPYNSNRHNYIYISPLPLEPPSYPHPTSLDHHSARWGSCVKYSWRLPTTVSFTHDSVCVSAVSQFIPSSPFAVLATSPFSCSLGKNTGAGCHFLFQEIFLTQQLNLGLLIFFTIWATREAIYIYISFLFNIYLFAASSS